MEIVGITKKGQATIPKKFREKFKFKDKAIVIETKEGVLFKPIPDISKEKGSLRKFFKRSAKEILEEARKNDYKREKFLEAI